MLSEKLLANAVNITVLPTGFLRADRILVDQLHRPGTAVHAVLDAVAAKTTVVATFASILSAAETPPFGHGGAAERRSFHAPAWPRFHLQLSTLSSMPSGTNTSPNGSAGSAEL